MKKSKKAKNGYPATGSNKPCFRYLPSAHRELLDFINYLWIEEKKKQVGIDLEVTGVAQLEARLVWNIAEDNLIRFKRMFHIIFKHGQRKARKHGAHVRAQGR